MVINNVNDIINAEFVIGSKVHIIYTTQFKKLMEKLLFNCINRNKNDKMLCWNQDLKKNSHIIKFGKMW